MSLALSIKKVIHGGRRLTWHHITVFLLTFLLYALYHASRKSFSNIKDLMAKSLSPSEHLTYPYDTWQKEGMFANVKDANVFLGELDFLFLLAYGIGLYGSGMIGDRVNLRYMLAFGIIGSSVTTFLYGYVAVPFDIQNKWYFRSLFFVNGLFQSTGRPGLVSVMANWFSKSSRGLVFGIWAINSNVGNMIGALLVATVLDYGYEYGILLNCVFSLCGGILVYFCLAPDPCDLGLTDPDTVDKEKSILVKIERAEANISEAILLDGLGRTAEHQSMKLLTDKSCPTQSDEQTTHATHAHKPIGLYDALLLPGVIPYALANACVKTVSYSFFMWLPTYLAQGLHWSDKDSGSLSNCFDVGGIIGTILTGILSDFFVCRSPVVSFSLITSMGLVYLYQAFASDCVTNVILMMLIGCTLVGPASLITSVISTDLGKNERIAGNTAAVATVSGIIDGTGSLGAALGQFVVGVISKYYGWQYVFYFLNVMIALGFLLILTISIEEIRAWRKSRNAGMHDDHQS